MTTDTISSSMNVFDDVNARQRQTTGATTAASIWAPQPQPSETTWPRTLDSFSRVAERGEMQIPTRPELVHSASMPGPVVTREDVFGPMPPQVNDARLAQPKEVGVIGDGRKTVTPEFDNSLLRTLNLNSPDPYNLKQRPSALSLNYESSPGSPDFSPISIASTLPTPTDLSPARSFDANYKPLHSPCELIGATRTHPYLAQQHALIYDPPSPTRQNHASSYPAAQTMLPGAASYLASAADASSFPAFKTTLEQSPTTTATTMPLSASYAYQTTPPMSLPLDNQKLFSSPTSTVSPLNQQAFRRADGSTFPLTRSLPPIPTVSTLGSEWHLTPQVLQHQNLLAQQQALQAHQLQQQLQHAAQLSLDWSRVEDGKLPPSLSYNGQMHTIGTSTVAAPGATIATAATTLGLGINGLGVGYPSGGLADSIHAVPQHMRSASSYGTTYPAAQAHVQVQTRQSQPQQQQQQEQTQNGGHSRHSSSSSPQQGGNSSPSQKDHEPINFLSLLHPSSSPPYHSFVARIIKSSDQQASIFLQQKLKVADATERTKIVDAICARGFEMMAHRFGNWAVQRCLEAASSVEERKKIVMCMRGRIVELATNCYGCHVLQKALDCEEDIRLLIVSELLLGDPAQTLVNKHASHVWSKIMELSWTPPAPPIFAYVNKSLRGKWAALACHETGSLVVQHAFENLEDNAKDGIVDELLNQGPSVFSEVAKNQWGSYCIQHILEHGSENHRQLTLDHLINGLLEYATNEQGYKSITKALKEGGKETLNRVVKRMCEPAKSGSRRAMIVDLALSVTGSQLIASVLPTADKDQRALLYECIRGHIVTLRGCKTGSKVIWLFDRMRAYYGY
uniref:PUM-HD domain-containing protein n=2 Tax=Moniliophthora roreri TaxID=221103 RepID=A0A0W0FE46_MONRR